MSEFQIRGRLYALFGITCKIHKLHVIYCLSNHGLTK